MRFKLLVIFIISIHLFSCENKESKVVELNTYTALDSLYLQHSYIEDTLVKNIYVNNFTSELKDLEVKEKKKLFIYSLLSNILLVNTEIIELRNEVLALENRSKSHNLNAYESVLLEKTFKKYRCSYNDFDCLAEKINIFPPSLIIAQGIIESGWGSSRFAIEANSIFGEHFSNNAEGKYIEASNSDIKLRAFESIKESIESYCINLSRHRAYRSLRELRNEMLKNHSLNSIELCNTLKSYSERGDDYVSDLKTIIRSNNLEEYDTYVIDIVSESLIVQLNKKSQ